MGRANPEIKGDSVMTIKVPIPQYLRRTEAVLRPRATPSEHPGRTREWWVERGADLASLRGKDFAAKYNVSETSAHAWRLELFGRRQAAPVIRDDQWWRDRKDDLLSLTSKDFAARHGVRAGTADRKRRELTGGRYDKSVQIQDKIKTARKLKANGIPDNEAAKIMSISKGYLRKLRHLGKEAQNAQ